MPNMYLPLFCFQMNVCFSQTAESEICLSTLQVIKTNCLFPDWMVALVNISHLLLNISAMGAAEDVLSSSVTNMKKYGIKKFECLGNLKSHLLESLNFCDQFINIITFLYKDRISTPDLPYGGFHPATAIICWYWWKLQYCNCWKKNFMKILVHLIWTCKHWNSKLENKNQFYKYVKNCPEIS